MNVDDLQRVARDVFHAKINLAVVGPQRSTAAWKRS